MSTTHILTATATGNYAAEMRIVQTPDVAQGVSHLTLTIWAKALSASFRDPFFAGGRTGTVQLTVNGTPVASFPAITGATPYRANLSTAGSFYQLYNNSTPAQWTVDVQHGDDGTASAAIQLALRFYNDATHYFDATWSGTVQLEPISVGNAYVGGVAADAYIYADGQWKLCDPHIYDGGEWKA